MTKTLLLGAGSLLALLAAAPAAAQQADHSGHHAPAPAADPHAGHEMNQQSPHAGHDEGAMHHEGHGGATSALGSYPSSRDASGTSWQPDSTAHGGLHASTGGWNLTLHALANLVVDEQGGPRGDDKVFVAGHLIAAASRPVGGGTLQFRAILSPDPLMGRSGYPLLLASGETANGRDRLVDRQHPHDLFGELSVSLSQPVGKNASVFVYAGLPGEPAFGPPVYLHRRAIQDSPEAPISHHWLDSTHTSFGVVTAGLVVGQVKIEASRFNGREPDQDRYNIETGQFDSTAARVAWNPSSDLSLQASWTHLVEPEQLEPGINQRRLSASALYHRRIGEDGWVAGTLAWGRRTQEGVDLDAYVIESGLGWKEWTFFGRGEITENNELVEVVEDGPAYRVGKLSAGMIRDFKVAPKLKLGLGGLVSVNFIADGLRTLYGGSNPLGAMAFVRLKVD